MSDCWKTGRVNIALPKIAGGYRMDNATMLKEINIRRAFSLSFSLSFELNGDWTINRKGIITKSVYKMRTSAIFQRRIQTTANIKIIEGNIKAALYSEWPEHSSEFSCKQRTRIVNKFSSFTRLQPCLFIPVSQRRSSALKLSCSADGFGIFPSRFPLSNRKTFFANFVFAYNKLSFFLPWIMPCWITGGLQRQRDVATTKTELLSGNGWIAKVRCVVFSPEHKLF